ncbi:hypothetical protein GGF32_004053 [Allomyces javanicus]|nr:hypothetical protein GGF32_004053 [Allomyces javanicus]
MASPLPAFDQYDFDHDATFQSGLAAILARTDAADPSARASATAKAKQFYYHKLEQAAGQASTSAPATNDTVAATTTHKPTAPTDMNTAADDEPAYPATFAEIVKLVSEGKPVPGIRDIPDVLNTAPPAVSRMAAPRKPWEQASS